MSELSINGHNVLETASFTVSMPYTAGSGWKQFTIQDTNKIYFDNNVCKKAGIYAMCVTLIGGSGTGTPSYAQVQSNGQHSSGAGWSGYMNPMASATSIKKFNVGDTATVSVQGVSATFGNTTCVVTKLN